MPRFPAHVEHKDSIIEMKVATSSEPRKLAGAIVNFIKEGKDVVLITIGAGPLNAAVKACIVARGMVAPEGLDVWTQQSFREEAVGNDIKTAVQTEVYLVRMSAPHPKKSPDSTN